MQVERVDGNVEIAAPEGPNEPVRHLMLNLLSLSEFEEASRNLVYLHPHDIKSLHPEFQDFDPKPYYVQLANRIYEIARNHDCFQGWIGLNPVQWEDAAPFMQDNASNYFITLTACDPLRRNLGALSYVQFEVSAFANDAGFTGEKAGVEIEDLDRQIHRNLDGQFLSKGQSFLIETKSGAFELKLKTHSGSSGWRFGRFTDKTAVQYVKADENVKLIGQVHSSGLTECRFFAKLKKREKNPGALFPIVLPIETVRKMIVDQTENQVVALGHSIKIFHSSGWDIKLSFLEAVYPEAKREMFYPKRHESGFKIDREELVNATSPGKRLVFTQGPLVTATEMSFSVVDIAIDQKGTCWRWISLEELAEEIRRLEHPFCQDMLFKVVLQSGTFVIECRGGIPIHEGEKRYRTPLRVGWVTKLHLDAEKFLDLEVITKSEAEPLTSLRVKLCDEWAESPTEAERRAIEAFLRHEWSYPIAKKQLLTVPGSAGTSCDIKIVEIESKNGETGGILGKITENTEILFETKRPLPPPPPPPRDLPSLFSPAEADIENPVKKLKELGLGGLTNDVQEVIERIFLSRGKMREEFERRGMKPVRGLLLYGIPGTGKTTLAKHLAALLGCEGERLIMKAGPELFDMWVGESERHVRELFEPAKEAAEQYGSKSQLYVVVIDEIDGLLPDRSSSSEWRETIVNQFLAEMDGLQQVHNLLIIGMTNLRERLDPAALRPGRFSEQIEIKVPNEEGRREILMIHSKALRKENLLDQDVDFEKLVRLTKGCSGAVIEGMIQKAAYISVNRLRKLNLLPEQMKDHPMGKVGMADLEKGLEEIKKEDDTLSEEIRRKLYS